MVTGVALSVTVFSPRQMLVGFGVVGSEIRRKHAWMAQVTAPVAAAVLHADVADGWIDGSDIPASDSPTASHDESTVFVIGSAPTSVPARVMVVGMHDRVTAVTPCASTLTDTAIPMLDVSTLSAVDPTVGA